MAFRENEIPKPVEGFKEKETGVLKEGDFWKSLLCSIFGHSENLGWLDKPLKYKQNPMKYYIPNKTTEDYLGELEEWEAERKVTGKKYRMGSRCTSCGRLIAFYLK